MVKIKKKRFIFVLSKAFVCFITFLGYHFCFIFSAGIKKNGIGESAANSQSGKALRVPKTNDEK